MAKTTTRSQSGAKAPAAKPRPAAKKTASASKPKSAPRKAARKPVAKAQRASSTSSASSSAGETAVDALLKLLESPLVADLLAVGATAALSAVAESRFSRRDDGHKSSRTVKNAGKAAAAAMGRRLNEEIEAIREAAAKAGSSAKA